MANIPLYGLLRYLSGRESAYNAGDAGDLGLIPRSRRSPGEGHGNPLQYSCLEIPMDRDALWPWSMGSQRVGHDWVTEHIVHSIFHIKKQRHYFANKGPSSQGYGFSSGHVWMWELDCKESWAPKNWCFWTVVLTKTLESPLESKEIKPVNPKGNQPWIFIKRIDAEAEAPILWLPDAKSPLIGKDLDTGKDWRQKEKGMAEDEMAG